ncbi:hypothetical protein COY27_00085 [Candidatus Woesearchaeota archaeon CG_4_10_14_0_2_um_filter_33_13]|nr:MAG: hypothetical protein COY27_00085 [Candidatus Woesearchaeota archaeon CG_4_10_14_0_2_um_filter_33_13]
MNEDTNSIEAKLEYDPVKNTLNGKPFVAKESPFYEKTIERACGNCFYHEDDGRPYRDCHLGSDGSSAHRFFGIPTDQVLPKTTEHQGKKIETGNYCPSFLDFRHD